MGEIRSKSTSRVSLVGHLGTIFFAMGEMTSSEDHILA